MNEEQYARKLLELIDKMAHLADLHYKHHERTEAFKRNQPSLHLCNGVHEGRNILIETFNKEISGEIRWKLADEARAKIKEHNED